jgi:hypothetical protein
MVDRLERLRPDVSMALAGGLYDSPGMRPRDPLSLVRRMGELDDLAVPTIEAKRPVDDDGPTSSFLANPRPAEVASFDVETVPVPLLPKTDGVPLPLVAAPTPAPMAGAPEGELKIQTQPATLARSSARPPTEQTSPTVDLSAPRVPQGSTPPPSRQSTPGPVSPRAPSHRQGSRELPAVAPSPMFAGSMEALGGKKSRPLVWIVAAVVAGVAGYLALPLFRSAAPRAAVAPPPADAAPPPDAAAPDAAPPARALSPCPPAMVLVQARPSFCIDTFEAPGEGKVPATGMKLEEASAACTAAGKRLCSGAEWERACRGQNRDSYPWGDSYAPDRCHLRAGDDARPVPAGQFKDCVSASGAHDMSGNVAEWVEEGEVRGASASDGRDGRCSRAVGHKPGPDVGYRCCAALVGAPPP